MQIEVLGERYQLQDPIGRGGMATIYRGRDMRMEMLWLSRSCAEFTAPT